MSFIKIIQQIACALCLPSKPTPKPQITKLSTSSEDVKTLLESHNVKLMYPVLLDYGSNYYYTKSEDWAKIFSYIYTEFDMPDYLMPKFDCDDFAFYLKGLVSALFGLNYFGYAIGQRHAYNFFQTEQGLMCFEPQTGEFFAWGERQYVPEWVLL